MGCVVLYPRLCFAHSPYALSPEDQQRINSFSKLNTRLSNIREKIESLKVRAVSVPLRYQRGTFISLCVGREGGS